MKKPIITQMINDVNGNNLSNIEIYHNKVTVQETVAYDTDELREHADITYKKYETGKWKVFSYKCKYCTATIKSVEKFVTHLTTCKGLEDDYVPKSKRNNPKGFI